MDLRCGSTAGYRDHVRDRTEKCEPCRRAHAVKRADYRRRRYLNHAPLTTDAIGTQRRLRALAAIGWSSWDIAGRLGITPPTLRGLQRRSRCLTTTRDRVAALYDELSMKPGGNRRAQGWAVKRGWAPPLAWDDIDDPAATPARPPTVIRSRMNRDPEREERVMELTRAGLSAVEIALRLRINERLVQRVRARYRDGEQAAS